MRGFMFWRKIWCKLDEILWDFKTKLEVKFDFTFELLYEILRELTLKFGHFLKFSTKFTKFLGKSASNFKEKLKPILRINFNRRIFVPKLAQILKHFFIKFALAFKNQLLFLPFWLGIYARAYYFFDDEIFLAYANVCKLKKRLFSSANLARV